MNMSTTYVSIVFEGASDQEMAKKYSAIPVYTSSKPCRKAARATSTNWSLN